MARRRSFTGQIITLQLITMVGVAALLSAACSWLIWQQHLASADAQTLAIVRSVATDPHALDRRRAAGGAPGCQGRRARSAAKCGAGHAR